MKKYQLEVFKIYIDGIEIFAGECRATANNIFIKFKELIKEQSPFFGKKLHRESSYIEIEE